MIYEKQNINMSSNLKADCKSTTGQLSWLQAAAQLLKTNRWVDTTVFYTEKTIFSKYKAFFQLKLTSFIFS